MTTPNDQELAKKYGGFISFETDTSPYKEEYYGESAQEEFDRLVRTYIQRDKRVLDIGCGAGQITCEMAAQAGEIWGVDEVEEVILAAQTRAEQQGLMNTHFIAGNKNLPEVLAQIPDDLDVIYCRRGPNLDKGLAAKLKVGGFFLQILVNKFDGYPLKEIMGRREYSPYHFKDDTVLMVDYSYWGMQPVSIRNYFYDSYFRDVDHLEAFLINIPAMFQDWRLHAMPYDRERDRAALELYAKYHTTPDGVRLMRSRGVFVLRKIELGYPVERIP